jgi:hypothetical protein
MRDIVIEMEPGREIITIVSEKRETLSDGMVTLVISVEIETEIMNIVMIDSIPSLRKRYPMIWIERKESAFSSFRFW